MVIATVACLTAGASPHPGLTRATACCAEIVAAPHDPASPSALRFVGTGPDASMAASARAVARDVHFALPVGAASEKVNELTPAVKLYNEGEYETAIPILWRIFQADRSNQDARSFLLRSYYNEGIGQLQNGLYPKAIESFGEVLAIDPQDVDSIRHKKFAERYLKGDLDLLGRIYVRHIQQRP